MIKRVNHPLEGILFAALTVPLLFMLTGCVPDINDTTWGVKTQVPRVISHHESHNTTYYDGLSSSPPPNRHTLSDIQNSFERTRYLEKQIQQEAYMRIQQQHLEEAAHQEHMRIQTENLRLQKKLAEEREAKHKQKEAYQAQQLHHDRERTAFKKRQYENRIARENAEQTAALAKSRSRAQEWQIEAQQARIKHGGNDQVVEGYGTAGLSDREQRLRDSEARALERSRARIARESAMQ